MFAIPFALSACGSSATKTFGDGGDAALPPTAAVACADLAQAQCNKRAACSGGTSVTRVFGTMDACLTRVALGCTEGLAAPQSGNSPTLVEQCVAGYDAVVCADFFDNNPSVTCTPAGPRAAGAACAFNGQCASAYCSGTKNLTCGTCAAMPAAAASCASSNCGHGQECVAATMLCGAYGAAASSCDATDFCGYGLSCTGSVAATSTVAATPGTCQNAMAQLGEACGGTMPGCDPNLGLFCGGAAGAKTCLAITLVADGMPCGNLSTTSRAECVAGACYTATGLAASTEVGTCKASAAEGAACDSVLGPACLTPARCLSSGAGSVGVCVLPDATTCG